MSGKSRRNNKGTRIILNVILVIAILCFLGSGGYLLKNYWDGRQAEKKVSALEDMILDDHMTVPDGSAGQTGDAGEGTADGQTETEEPGGQYRKLLEANSDFIGWISIDGTKLNYPVMFTPQDPEYYLHRNFDKVYEYSGLPFVDGRCSLNPASTNVIIYGHNMKNDTMFSVLLEYQDKEWYEQHKRITFNTIYGDATYEVAAVILSKAFNKGEEGFRYYGMVDAADQAEFDDYMANIRRMQLYDTGVEVSYGDSLITLSTCEYSQENGRIAVIAKKVE